MLLMTTPVRRRGRPYHHGNLRRALLREAAALLRMRGAEALSLRAVARRTGVSPAAPYAHFPDKAALVAALAADGFRLLTVAMRRAFKEAGADAFKRLKTMAAAYVGFAVDHPAHFAIMFGDERPPIEQHPDLHEAAHDATGVLLAAMLDCQREGCVMAGDPMELALFVWVLLHGIAVLVLADFMPGVTDPRRRRADAVRLAESYVERALRGIAPR